MITPIKSYAQCSNYDCEKEIEVTINDNEGASTITCPYCNTEFTYTYTVGAYILTDFQ